MKGVDVNAVARGFDFENLDVAPPIGARSGRCVRIWAVPHRPYKERPDDSNHG